MPTSAINSAAVIFAPAPGGFGVPYTTLGFFVNDGQFDSVPATVTIKVVPPPTPPTGIVLSTTNLSSTAGPGSFLAALRSDSITAPCLFDGPINGESFIAYVEQMLVPELSERNTVILDNLGSHKSHPVTHETHLVIQREGIQRSRDRIVQIQQDRQAI